MSLNKTCAECAQPFTVPNWRPAAKFCSRSCSDKHPRTAPNQTCSHCSKPFHMKPSQLKRYPRTLGVFCSHACIAAGKRVGYAGERNPNYKGKNTDSDGYRMYVPSASHAHGGKGMKLHQAVCCEVLGIEKMPRGVHIHHRDCDITNNTPENLVVLGVSDHKWLHKQFGVAVLWAYCRGKVALDDLLAWSDDPARAKRLLPLNVVAQAADWKHKQAA